MFNRFLVTKIQILSGVFFLYSTIVWLNKENNGEPYLVMLILTALWWIVFLITTCLNPKK